MVGQGLGALFRERMATAMERPAKLTDSEIAAPTKSMVMPKFCKSLIWKNPSSAMAS